MFFAPKKSKRVVEKTKEEIIVDQDSLITHLKSEYKRLSYQVITLSSKYHDSHNRWTNKNRKLKAKCDHLQAVIDSLMLEYCPNDMTEKQIRKYASCQVPVEEDDVKIH